MSSPKENTIVKQDTEFKGEEVEKAVEAKQTTKDEEGKEQDGSDDATNSKWTAVWDNNAQAYYWWNTESNETTWVNPESNGEDYNAANAGVPVAVADFVIL
ncbi:unnamed protein product [Mucor hiemalis]